MSDNKLNNCEHCGQPLDSDGICQKCNPISEQEPDLNQTVNESPKSFIEKVLSLVKKHKIISIASAATVFVVAFVSILLIVFLPSTSDKLLKAAEEGNLGGFGAFAYYDELKEIHSNPRKLSKIEKSVKKKVEKVYEDFQRGKISYDAAYAKVESYELLTKSDSATEKYVQGIGEKIDLLNNSMSAYGDAVGFEEKGDINSALLKYAEVVEDDKSYKDARSRIEKLSNTFVEKLKTFEANKDYRSIVMQGAELSENRRITESAREQISALVNSARAALKASAENLLTVEVKEDDTGGTYLAASTKTFEAVNSDGLRASIFGASEPEDSDTVLAFGIAFFPPKHVFVNKTLLGTTQKNITGGASIETDYAGYGQYYVEGGKDAKYLSSGRCGTFNWEEAKNLYDIFDGKEQVYLKVFSSYSDDSFSFPIPEELRLSTLALLDYHLAIYKEKPTDSAS